MKNSFLTCTDQFCGAGGSSQGVRKLSNKMGGGIEVLLAMNHWKLAVETHNTNFPNTEHDLADISSADPRRYKSTDILITSPECTCHSLGKGVKRQYQQTNTLFGELTIDPAAERSRATMWDVPRFAEIHHYNLIIVENVVEARHWIMWDAWLHAMRNLGYMHKCVYLNSMHVFPTPQSRDRMYVVFWKKGNKAPDLDYKPKAYCKHCSVEIEAIQSWKDSRKKFGKYRQQYLYRCPKCTNIVEPFYYSAFNIIDWSIPGTKIGDRKKPLASNTTKRIEYGLKKYPNDDFIVYLDHSKAGNLVSGINSAINTQTTAQVAAILTRGNYNWDSSIISSDANLNGLISGTSMSAFLSYYYGNSQASSVFEPTGTITTKDRLSLVIKPESEVDINECYYRMIKSHEVQSAMAFEKDYVVLGDSRDKVKQLGNAVTPPVMEWLLERGIQTFA